MSPARRFFVSLALVTLLGLVLLFRRSESPPARSQTARAVGQFIPAPPSPPFSSPDRPANAPPPPFSNSPGHPDAQSFGTASLPPEQEPAALLAFLECYRREFGSFPSGNENHHFLHALAGQNPSQLVIFPMSHPRVGPNGQLLDAWGSPFSFHSISRHHLEIRSAGPDRLPFTSDDLLAPTHRPQP